VARRLQRIEAMIKRALALIGLLGVLSSGCLMSPRTAAGLGRAAVVAAVIAADVALLAAHDAHYHGYGCGHHHRYRDGHYSYYYDGRWEYYTGGRWYYYVD